MLNKTRRLISVVYIFFQWFHSYLIMQNEIFGWEEVVITALFFYSYEQIMLLFNIR